MFLNELHQPIHSGLMADLQRGKKET